MILTSLTDVIDLQQKGEMEEIIVRCFRKETQCNMGGSLADD